ncbi:hemagglutinin repeat-containing protein [Pseudomonas protegens]|uniref:two-partner secretion domain-containing protein n=1 Tax=Pseudomonas protegens TaxID=380021 RepID=UPI00287E1387|nr:hemagglutinin repeat-containing protein [Pseudomonas protegens]MDS9876015.1 hemagglutinin repeat-containing protein [Pseudomonas protegens]
MDVRQLAFLARQPSATLQARDSFWGLSKRGLAFILANVMFWQPLVAMADGIVVNGSGTTLGQAGNGVPIVNIATPNGGGLSHNKFSDYNVGQQGVILNNATGRTQETQLGGIILGNPNLGGRAANVILNEVNGGSPSQLKGYTEVAGQAAHVIVANPYGVSCNGCGFINTPKATLTTGKPVIENGQVQRYQVDQGSVAIEGAGLNASNIDQFEIITRSAKINAEIQARHLAVVAGANDVDAKTLNATARTANPADAPQLAIDSSALGGMYAGAIKLVGTEAGVGVKLDGKLIASGGDIQLDANGQLRMAEATAEKGAVAIKAGSLEAQGAVYAGSELKVQTRGDLNNHSTLAAANSINLGSGGQLNNHGIIEAGVNLDNSRNPNGDVTLTAQNLNNSGKSVVASRDLTVTTTQTLNNQGGSLSGQRQVTVSAGALDNSRQGKLLSAERLQLDAEQVRNGQGGLIKSQQSLNATLGHLGNSGGELSSQGSSTLVLAGMDNLTGVVLAQQTLTITGSAELDNQGGLLSGWQGLTLNGTGLNNSNKGTVSSLKGGVEVALSDALNNSQGGGLVSQQALDVKAASLDNSLKGMISSAGAQSLKISDRLDNSQGGSIDSAATLTLQAMTLGNNGGTLDAAGDLTFTGTDLDNGTGTFTGKTAVTLNLLGALNNTHGKLASGGPLRIERAGQIDNRGGQMASQGLLSLFAASLDNRNRGTLMANDPLTLTLDGALQNSGDGLIYSQTGGLHVQAGSLTNGKGTLQSQGALNLSTGDIDNQSGRILARNGNLNIGAGHLDNRGGVLSSVQGAMTADLRGVLKNGYDPSNNRQGGVTQAQRLTLKALAGIDNDGGRISAQSGDALITTGDFDNRNGGLYAKGLVKVSGGHFDNSGNNGQIAGQQINFDLSGALNNHKGIIESDSSLTIKAASLDNQTGQLRALGDGGDTRLELGGLFDNRDGSLETANQNLAFDAGSFNNRGGSVLHSGNGLFGLSMANLEDVGGRLKTAGQLILEGERWANSSSIQAGKLTVNVNHLTQARTGQLLAGNGLIGSGVNWINDGLIGSDAGVNIDLSGHYSSKGRLSSFGQLDLKAAQVDLADSASIAGGGNTTVSVFGQLNNAGRLSAAAGLTLNASGINNQGTLGAAQNLTLTTGGLLNDHGLVFSGDDMGLRVDTLTNSYGNVYSLGHLTIDRDGQGALASRIANRSGTLQSDGSMTLAASTLENMRDVLATNNGGIYTARIAEVACIEGYNAGDCGGKRNHVWEIVQRDKFEVTEASAASSIAAGVNLNINAGDLLNQSSSISAAGNLMATVNNLTHSGVETGETETTRVFMSARTKNASAWYNVANAVTNRYWFQSAGYTPDDLGGLEGALAGFIGMTEREWVGLGTTKKLAGGDQSYAAVIQAGGAVSIKAGNGFDSSVVRPGYTYVGSGARTDTQVPDTAFATRISLSPQLPPDLTQQQVNPLALPGFSLPAGQNGLFRLSGQSSSATPAPAQIAGLPDAANLTRPHKYLIETNPVLTDLKQFMSSDYLLSSLGYNPDDSAKRLGDGFYEQKLIQQAVQARTGQRFIDGQNSDEQLFKYLMDNAIQSRQQLNLSVGVALTSEQVAALTHDIVWLESHEVNGEQVLVPVLYLAQAKNRLAPNGALIAGNDVNLIAGQDLNNVGTLRATNNLSAQAGQNLINSGLVEAGNRLDLLAGNDLVNKAGGIIAGRDVSLAATRGDVINERTLTSHQSSNGSYAQQRDFVDNAARVEAANSLVISAGRDINNNGGVLKSGADTSLKVGRDVNLSAVEQVVSNDRGVRYNDLSVTQNGSSLQAGRDLAISAGRDITAIASQIEAKRDVAMTATENLSLVSAANDQHAYSKTKKVTSQEDHVQQVGTSLKGGGDVTLSAGQELALIASRVTAGDEAYLVAGKNLALKAAEDQDYSFYSKTKKSSSGKKFRLDETESISNVGSLVSAGTNSVLVAGENLQLQGSAVIAEKGNAQLVAGKNVQILAVTDSESDRHERKQSKSSWGGLKSSKVEDKVSETRTTAIGSMVSGDTVSVTAGRDATVTGSSLVSTGDLSVQAVRDLTIDAATNTFSRTEIHKQKNRDLTGVLTANNLGLDDITGNQHLSISSQKHDSNAQETTLTGSTIGSSAGNVTLTAGRELKIVASDLVSTKDMSLSGADVTIAAGTETARQTSSDSSRSLAVGRVVGGVVIDTAKSIRNDIRAAKEADDSRLKAVKGAQALLSAYNAVGNQDSGSAQESEGKPANSSGSLIKIGTELANTRSKSSSEYDSETAKQSILTSGAGLVISAGGDGAGAKGDIHVIGSSLKAENTALIAKSDIVLQSAQDRAQWDNQNTNSKTSVGASFNIGDQNGFTLDLGAQIAKGMGTGHSVTQVNSTIDTGLLLLTSGQDTTLAGAQVRADTIKADIGGNLNIASRQDEASQKNQQKSAGAGVSLCIPPFCYGSMVTASGNIAGSKMNSDYKAVTDQTGLYAGKGGYDIHVGETTQLQGAVIASNANAEQNRLDTGRLLVSDIKNKSEIKSQAASLSASYTSTKWDNPRGPVTPDDQRKWAHSETEGTLPIALKESDHSSTRSAISEGTITVRDPAGANDLVGLNRDTANANQRLDRPDEKAMQERIDLIQSSAQLASSVINTVAKAKADAANKAKREAEKSQNPEQIAAANAAAQDAASWNVGGDKRIMADIASGLVAAGLGGAGGSTAVGVVAYTSSADVFKKIGDYADAQHKNPKADSATKAAWAEGGAARVLLHALAGATIGLSSGNAGSGALGAGTSAALMPAIAEALKSSGIEEYNQDAIAALIATSLGGSLGAIGGVSGAVVAGENASGVEVYNRQIHREQEIPLLKKKAEDLEKTLGKPKSDALWEDLLILASGAKLDEVEKARLDALDKKWGNDPTADWFRLDLDIAKEEVRKLADQKIPLTWADGRPIVAHGAPVYAFSSTGAQFKDSSLFNVLGKGYYGELSLAEKWNQYGKQQTTEHAKEILDISSSYLSTKDAADRLMSLAVKNTAPVGIIDEVILTVGMPGGKLTLKAIEAALVKRQEAKLLAGKGGAFLEEPPIKMSDNVRELYSKGKYREALDVHYEDLVRRKVGGESQVINGREIDVVTDVALIQVKRTYSAIEKPNNFLNKATRNQIKFTIETAVEQGKRAEFWFKYGVSSKVRNYIEGKGGIVKVGLGE